jgi:hypothetical protein
MAISPARQLAALNHRERIHDFENRGHQLELAYLRAKGRGDQRRMDELATAMVSNSKAMLAAVNSRSGQSRSRRAPVVPGFLTRDFATEAQRKWNAR